MQKNIVITGAASGLGKALALRWAKAGANVCVADINDERGDETVHELKKLNVQSFYQRCDITCEAQVQALHHAVKSNFSSISVLVNNAGVASGGSVEEETLDIWQWVMDINVFGAVRMVQTFAPTLKEQAERGHILNVASLAGLTSMPMMGSYGASKAAMVSFSETLRLELVDDGIDVSVLCPGFFKTNLNESLRTNNPGMTAVVDRFLERSTVTADDVAESAFRGVGKNKFMIQSHGDGRLIYGIKRYLPNYYLRLMTKRTQKLREFRRKEK